MKIDGYLASLLGNKPHSSSTSELELFDSSSDKKI
jgi:hypothetical protein